MYKDIIKIESKKSRIYAFNIVLEAKVLTLVDMTKKFHPEMDKGELSNLLHRAIDYAIDKRMK